MRVSTCRDQKGVSTPQELELTGGCDLPFVGAGNSGRAASALNC